MQRDVFHFQAVRVPFGVAQSALRDEPARLLDPAIEATRLHASRLETVLDVDLDGLVLGTTVEVEFDDFDEISEPLPLARRKITWRATDHPTAFPILEGEVEAYPLSAKDTQVTFTCRYHPPLKAVGAVVDTVYLHRVAEECLERFFDRLVASLESVWAEMTTG